MTEPVDVQAQNSLLVRVRAVLSGMPPIRGETGPPIRYADAYLCGEGVAVCVDPMYATSVRVALNRAQLRDAVAMVEQQLPALDALRNCSAGWWEAQRDDIVARCAGLLKRGKAAVYVGLDLDLDRQVIVVECNDRLAGEVYTRLSDSGIMVRVNGSARYSSSPACSPVALPLASFATAEYRRATTVFANRQDTWRDSLMIAGAYVAPVAMRDGHAVPGPCITFLVYAKGVMPLGDWRVPAEIGGIPTDVREGLFTCLSRESDTVLHSFIRPLLAGSQICCASETLSWCSTGTIGAVAQYTDSQTQQAHYCCITAAHCVLEPPTERAWRDNPEVLMRGDAVPLCRLPNTIYQPMPSGPAESCRNFLLGHTGVFPIFNWNRVPGVDAAAVVVDASLIGEQTPLATAYPVWNGALRRALGLSDDVEIRVGQCYGAPESVQTRLVEPEGTKVYKLGATTGLTRAVVVHANSTVARSLCTPAWDVYPLDVPTGAGNLLPVFPSNVPRPDMRWKGQVCLQCTEEDKMFNREMNGLSVPYFALPGDSGSVIWSLDAGPGRAEAVVHPIGLLHTGDSREAPQVYLATPMQTVLSAVCPAPGLVFHGLQV
jgi:hypothetical protein